MPLQEARKGKETLSVQWWLFSVQDCRVVYAFNYINILDWEMFMDSLQVSYFILYSLKSYKQDDGITQVEDYHIWIFI